MDLANLLSRVDSLKKEIDSVRPIKPEQERRIMEKFRLDWNYHSNAIEGNQLTLGETRTLLLEGLTAHGKPLKDSLDIKGHNEVITFLEAFIARKEILTEAVLREMHRILLHEPYQVQARTPEGGVTTKWVKLGEYKTEPNFVQTPTGEMRSFTLPQDTAAKMHELMEWFRKETQGQSVHPVIIASIFHHRFTQIHPFDDGNGRMARLLMNLILMQHGLLPVIIRTTGRDSYLAALAKADAGEQTDLVSLIAGEEIFSEELFLRGARGEDIADVDDLDKRIALLKQELRDVEEPVELTVEIQKQIFERTIKPMLTRLFKKIAQFDELYSSKLISLTATIRHQGGTRQLTYPKSLTESELISGIESQIMRGEMFETINVGVSWSNFRRAGPNRFDDGFLIQIKFDKFSYRITPSSSRQKIIKTYESFLSEDELTKFVNDITAKRLEVVESQIKKK